MRHLIYAAEPQNAYPVCILVPQIRSEEIRKTYIEPFGLNPDLVLVLELHTHGKKTPVTEMKQYINEELQPLFKDYGVQYLIVADGEYFKVFTKQAKAEANLGYILSSVWGPQEVVYVPNFKMVFYDPDKVKAKIAQGMSALQQHVDGTYKDPGITIIKQADYPKTVYDIEVWLDILLGMDCDLSCDTENFSLKHHSSGIGTITFCWSKHEGIAFPVDLGPAGFKVRELLRNFFEKFQKKMIYHSITYDVYILVYQLFMKDILDTEGMLYGMEVLLRNWDDTKIITYLATNSCAGNKLGLKDQAQEFAGNYVVDEIHDIRKIPLKELLQYNLIDGLSTWYVHEKHYSTMVADQQLDIYENLFKPCVWDIIQMQLTGMPVNYPRVLEVKAILEADERKALDVIETSPITQRFIYQLDMDHVAKRNATLVKKRIAYGDEPQEFNPNSGPQLQVLLYDMLGLPVLGYTDKGQPSTEGEILKALLNHTQDPEILAFLQGMVDYKAVNKLITSFIPALETSVEGPDGWHYLFGNFNLGGTVSGRLSSSKPNLQNLPSSGTKYAKLIKSCFQAPPGWLFVGLDFASLEDKISGLTTKDPMKLKVYTDGYDGHCLRAYAYFKEQMPDIDPDSVASINSIAKKYKPQRQDSKVPTFALTYDGTFRTLMVKCGFSEEKARAIEARYHELYHVSDSWISAKLDEAAKTGYVTVAFGLRVRTPLLKQVIRKTSKTPYEAQSEGRSAGNAMGQSWCMLNSRAHMAFMKKVRASKYRLNIRPSSQIHDAGYYIIKDDVNTVLYTNDTLVPETFWQEHPDIAHHEVKLGGELSIFHPTWAEEIAIPNGATASEIFDAIDLATAPKH